MKPYWIVMTRNCQKWKDLLGGERLKKNNTKKLISISCYVLCRPLILNVGTGPAILRSSLTGSSISSI